MAGAKRNAAPAVNRRIGVCVFRGGVYTAEIARIAPFGEPLRILDENSLPLGVLPVEDEPLNPRSIDRAVWALLFLGLAARLLRYALSFPIWQDEAYLAINYIYRDYMGLAAALENHQVCPLLFLWIQYTVVKLLGFSVASLRLFPFICGVAALFLFRYLAARLLRGAALLFAVGIFAVAYPLIRYSCESKPYNCDMFFSLAMLTLAIGWWQSRDTRRLWALTAMTPLALGFSFPCAFTGGGLSLAIGLGLLVRRERKGCMIWIIYNIVLLGSFALFYVLSVRNQSVGELDWMQDYWRSVFPPLDSPLQFAKWLAVVHTGELMQYPVGGPRGASILTTVCCAAGLIFLWRRKQFMLAVFCLAPLVPNFAAACMQRYPYGSHVRFALYLAPAFCLLAGIGAAALLVKRKNSRTRGRVAVVAVVALLVIIAGASIARDFAFPYRTDSVRRHRDFARWFWETNERDARVFCWETDIDDGRMSSVPHSAVAALYLCNREMYWRRPAKDPSRAPQCTAPASSDNSGSLRCVRFSSFDPTKKHNLCASEADDKAFRAWLEAMRENYDPVSRQTYELPISSRHGLNSRVQCIDTVTVFEFVPRTTSSVR